MNFDTELSTVITGHFGFVRLTDTSVSPRRWIPQRTTARAEHDVCLGDGSRRLAHRGQRAPRRYDGGLPQHLTGEAIHDVTLVTPRAVSRARASGEALA